MIVLCFLLLTTYKYRIAILVCSQEIKPTCLLQICITWNRQNPQPCVIPCPRDHVHVVPLVVNINAYIIQMLLDFSGNHSKGKQWKIAEVYIDTSGSNIPRYTFLYTKNRINNRAHSRKKKQNNMAMSIIHMLQKLDGISSSLTGKYIVKEWLTRFDNCDM